MNKVRTHFHLGRLLRIALIISLVTILIVVVFQNRESVETRILFSKFEMPRAALLFVTFAIGVVTGVLTLMALRSRTVNGPS